MASQQRAINDYGLERAVEEPFAGYRTAQVTIARVQRLTGLTFTHGAGRPLSGVDTLKGRARAGAAEAEAWAEGEGEVALGSLADVVF